MPANTSRKDAKSKSPIIKSSVCGLISSALFFAFIVLFAFLSLKADFSASAYMPAGLFFGALTGFIGGFISAKLSNEKGALYGLLSGAVQTFICFIFLFFANENTVGKGMLIISILIIAFSVAGGIAGINLKFKKKY